MSSSAHWAEALRWDALVHKIARQFSARGACVLEHEDLVSAGRIGAFKAVRRRNGDGTTFGEVQWVRFLATYIRCEIRDEVYGQARPLRLPKERRADWGKMAGAVVSTEDVTAPARADRHEGLGEVLEEVDRLDDRTRAVLRMWFGLDGDAMSLREIGRHFKSSHQVMMRRLNRGLAELRARLEDSP